MLGSKACAPTPGFRMPFILHRCGEVTGSPHPDIRCFIGLVHSPKITLSTSFGVATLAAAQQVMPAMGFPTCCAILAYWFSESFRFCSISDFRSDCPSFTLRKANEGWGRGQLARGGDMGLGWGHHPDLPTLQSSPFHPFCPRAPGKPEGPG